MRKITLTLIIGLLSASLFDSVAQSLSSKNAFIGFTNYSKEPLPKDAKTYSFSLNPQNFELNLAVMSQVVLGDLKKVDPSTSPNLFYEIQYQNPRIQSKKLKSETSKEGVVTYFMDVQFTAPSRASISKGSKSGLIFTKVYYRELTTLTFGPYASQAEAESAFSDDARALITVRNRATSEIALDINRTFYGPYTSFKWTIYSAKGKKMDFSVLDGVRDKVHATFKNAKVVREISNDQATILREAIQEWTKAIKEDERLTDEIVAGLELNIGIANLFLSNLQESNSVISKLSTQSLSAGLGRSLKDFEVFMNRMEPNYLKHSDRINLMEYLAGTWKIVKFESERAVDTNKNGVKSKDVLDQLGTCFQEKTFQFAANGRLQVRGSGEGNCQNEDQYWRIRKDTMGNTFILMDEDRAYLNSDANSIQQILNISFDTIEVKLEAAIDPSSDTTQEAIIVYKRQ